MQNPEIESNVVASLLSRRSRPSTYPSSLQSSDRSGGRSVKTDLPPSGKRSSKPVKEADMIYISQKASRIRQRESQRARDNRAEIVKARSIGQITRRDLYKWGLLTATGALALKNGLSPFAKSAFGQVPTGTPLSPLYGAQRFTTRLPRLVVQTAIPLTRDADGNAAFPANLGERPARRLSYHTDFTANPADPNFINPI